MSDIKQMETEAERCISLSRKAPVGSRTWRLLREEAYRIETECNQTRGHLTSMRRAPGAYMYTETNDDGTPDGSLESATK